MQRSECDRGPQLLSGLGWVCPRTERVELPGAEPRVAPPEGALTLQLVDDDAGRLALVRGLLLDDREHASIARALSAYADASVFVLAAEEGAYAVTERSDVRRAALALASIERSHGIVRDVVVSSGGAVGFVGEPCPREPSAECVARVATRSPTALQALWERHEGSVVLLRADLDRSMAYAEWLGPVAADLLRARAIALAFGLFAPPAVLSLHRHDVVIALPDAELSDAREGAQQLVDTMRKARVQLRHPELPQPYVTWSVGGVFVPRASAASLSRAVYAMDRAVQTAKSAGRDRYALTTELPSSSRPPSSLF